jgi:hypothetical protein
MPKKIKSKFMFSDGTKVYNNINKYHKTHKKGYSILGPPGIGKTTYINGLKEKKKNWVDSDNLCRELNVKWRQNEKNPNEFRLNYLRADYILEQSRLLGYRIIGALFWEHKADAIVILPFKKHLEYASKRKDLNIQNIKNMRKIFKDHAKKFKIPIFKSIEEAVEYLE